MLYRILSLLKPHIHFVTFTKSNALWIHLIAYGFLSAFRVNPATYDTESRLSMQVSIGCASDRTGYSDEANKNGWS